MKKIYTFKDVLDKTPKGLEAELRNGLTVGACYFFQSEGIPLDIFNEWLASMTRAEQWLWYMNFRNRHKELFT